MQWRGFDAPAMLDGQHQVFFDLAFSRSSISFTIHYKVRAMGRGQDLHGQASVGYDHGHDAQFFCLRIALDSAYIEGFVEGCLRSIGKDDSEEDCCGVNGVGG
jgi:hypothetical protein